jgi:hypothetical protein
MRHVLKQLSVNGDAYDQDLAQFVAFKSVSALPRHLPDLLAAAEWLVERLKTAGLQVCQSSLCLCNRGFLHGVTQRGHGAVQGTHSKTLTALVQLRVSNCLHNCGWLSCSCTEKPSLGTNRKRFKTFFQCYYLLSRSRAVQAERSSTADRWPTPCGVC